MTAFARDEMRAGKIGMSGRAAPVIDAPLHDAASLYLIRLHWNSVMRDNNRVCRALFVGLLITGIVVGSMGCALPSMDRASADRRMVTSHVTAAPLSIETKNGAVRLAADDSLDEVHIVARITCGGSDSGHARERLDAAAVIIERDDEQHLRIHPIFPEPAMNGDGCGLDVRVPDAGRVAIRTSNGSVDVMHLAASIDVRTSNGRIALERLEGQATLVTSNGAISIDDQLGAVDARTSNGSIAVELRDDAAEPIELITSNGRIRLSVGSTFAGRVVMSTSNAGIAVRDLAEVVREQSISKSRGRVVLGDGGDESCLSTSNGAITLTIRD